MTGSVALRVASVNMNYVLSAYLPCLLATGTARPTSRLVTYLLRVAVAFAVHVDDLVLARHEEPHRLRDALARSSAVTALIPALTVLHRGCPAVIYIKSAAPAGTGNETRVSAPSMPPPRRHPPAPAGTYPPPLRGITSPARSLLPAGGQE